MIELRRDGHPGVGSGPPGPAAPGPLASAEPVRVGVACTVSAELGRELCRRLDDEARGELTVFGLPQEGDQADGGCSGVDPVDVELDVLVFVCDTPGEALEQFERQAAQGRGTVTVVACRAPEPAQRTLLRREGAGAVVDLSNAAVSPTGLLESISLIHASVRWAAERGRLLEDLQRARELGQHLAHHDTLTGLPNRQYFRSRLRQALAQARRHDRLLAVLFVDLDRFKQINDSLGHPVGDEVLGEIARRLQGCIRATDFAARSGGDEFLLVLTDIRRGQDAARVARKITKAIAEPIDHQGTQLFPSASIGISLFPADGDDEDSLVKHADAAMYQAKDAGRSNFRFYLPQMTDRALERLALESRLRAAIEREEFVLHYQPRVALETGRIHGMEALVRWEHPDLGLVSPDEFIPVAEETGLIVELGAWVAKEACRQLTEWDRMGLGLATVAINVSARQFELSSPVQLVREALERSGLSPERLEIEITESAVMQNRTAAIDALAELRCMGLGVAIDDFGTGHSSLAYLKRFPLTKLKIDKAFVRTLLDDAKDEAIVQAIIDMAHSLGLEACAEGVETKDQLAALSSSSCDEIQGYVFSRPLPAPQAADLLRENREGAALLT